MRTAGLGLVLSSVLVGVVALYASGCFDARDDCALNPILQCGPWAPHAGTSSSSTSSGGHDGGPDADSGPDCSGDPTVDASIVSDDCGVFAQADAPGTVEDGSMAHPYKTLQKAIDNAGAKRVYACTSAPFSEAVTISAGLDVYGGFDCAKGWSWSSSARSELDGPADAVALTIAASADGAKVEGFKVEAASPSAPMMGGSSIAVVVADVAATLDGCDVIAGDAADGSDGTPPNGTATKGTDAAMPDPGTMNACINPASVNGGVPGSTMCGGVDTSGGVGGKGGVTGTMGGDGQSGANGANPAMMPKMGMDGLAGTGQSDPAGTCTNGDPGAPGSSGAAGNGGSEMGDMLSLAGISNADVTDGQSGAPGQGGGGGGGAMSGTFCPPAASPVDGPGASGGGGGAGGCGGLGGGGGKAGGSSIAIVSLGNKLTLAGVTLAVGKGGGGGKGTLGQSGGAYGLGVVGGATSGLGSSNAGCQGGNGGKGGNGGPGGGGRGGHAIGIAYAQAPATMPALQMFTGGTPGIGGTAGNGAPSTSMGANGSAGPCWDFTNHAACN